MKTDKVLLGHGSGGRLSHELVQKVFYKYFKNVYLDVQSDASVLPLLNTHIAFTTDSYVVDPVFFPGGNIGKLAVCGTVNDLAVSGAKPLYLSASFIIEEGFPMADLETIVQTMALEAEKAGIKIVTGDTKVVNKGKCDKIFITTSGIGSVTDKNHHIHNVSLVKPGDAIIINGPIADHGMAIMGIREGFNFQSEIKSDCASLNVMIEDLTNHSSGVHFMRDATRGGLATVLAELAAKSNLGIEIDELQVPVNENTRGMCEILGFDPMYVANEGKVVLIVDNTQLQKTLEILQKHETGVNSAPIGYITELHPGKAVMKTSVGGKRIIDMLAGEQLPRIC